MHPALTVGTWRTTRDMVVLDLAELPPVPSLFDVTERIGRPWLRFLHHFSRELSKSAGTTPEVDYVPTQIFTKYIRTELRDHSDALVEGVRFRSSLNPGGFCWVLFVAA